MNNTFKPDYISISFVLIGSVIGFLTVINKYREIKSVALYKQSISLLLGGLSFVFLSTLGNSLFRNHWEINYVISFLLLKELSKDWFFRHLCSFGYILFIWGILIISVSVVNKSRNKSKM